MFGPGIAISASAASANSASVDGAGIARAYRPTAAAGPSAPDRRRTPARLRRTLGAVIARVEPLTTTRRLSGPFDYRVEDGESRSARSCASRSGTRSSTGSSSGSPRPPRSRTRSSSRPRRCARTRSRATSSTSRCGWPRSTARRPRGRSRSSRRRPGRPRRRSGPRPTGAEGRVNDNQRALLERLPGPGGRRPGGAAAAREARAGGDHRSASPAARRARTRAPDRAVEPTAAQADALAAIEAAPGEAHLLHGVTGSGKTEVYLRAAAAALERGEGVIALVPEIALTPQTVARFAARFGDTVALLHSALSRGRALRRVAAAAHGRGADRRRPALGGLRAGRATSG